MKTFIEQIDKKINGLNLINNAGINLDNLSIRLTERENWKKVLDIKPYIWFFNV